MDHIFHALAPGTALKYMPEKFRDFLVGGGFRTEDLARTATYPDLLDHDNIQQCAEIHHAHSYKIERVPDSECGWKIPGSGMKERGPQFKWLDGDCLKTIESLCAVALDAWKEFQTLAANKQPAAPQLIWLVQYALAKMTHYRVDALTYPHLHRGAPWSKYHASFESHMDAWISKHEGELGDFAFEPYDHVYRGCRQTAIEAWIVGEELVGRLEAGEKLREVDCLLAAQRCIQGVGDLWSTVAQQMELG